MTFGGRCQPQMKWFSTFSSFIKDSKFGYQTINSAYIQRSIHIIHRIMNNNECVWMRTIHQLYILILRWHERVATNGKPPFLCHVGSLSIHRSVAVGINGNPPFVSRGVTKYSSLCGRRHQWETPFVSRGVIQYSSICIHHLVSDVPSPCSLEDVCPSSCPERVYLSLTALCIPQ